MNLNRVYEHRPEVLDWVSHNVEGRLQSISRETSISHSLFPGRLSSRIEDNSLWAIGRNIANLQGVISKLAL